MRFDFLFSPNWNRKKKCLVHSRNIIHFKGLMCGSNKSSVEPWHSVCYMVHPVKAVVHLSLSWGSQLRTDVISVNCPCYWWFQELGRCSDFKRQYLSVILSCLFHWDCSLISLLYLSLYTRVFGISPMVTQANSERRPNVYCGSVSLFPAEIPRVCFVFKAHSSITKMKKGIHFKILSLYDLFINKLQVKKQYKEIFTVQSDSVHQENRVTSDNRKDAGWQNVIEISHKINSESNEVNMNGNTFKIETEFILLAVLNVTRSEDLLAKPFSLDILAVIVLLLKHA